MIRSIVIILTIIVVYSCSTKSEKGESEVVEKIYFIPRTYYSDHKIFPKLSRKYIKKKKAEIERFYSQTFGKDKFSGGFLVAKNGQIIFEKYQGYSNFEKGKRNNSRTPIHLASVGKVLTATAVFRLVHLGKLKFDQKVNSILTLFPYETITIRMLLNHRSGVPKYAYFASQDSLWNKKLTLSNEDILDILTVNSLPLDFVPDTKFTYNNSNYALLALVIEKVTKQTFSQAMKKLVFEPIGMKNSFVMNLKNDSTIVSQSYKSNYQKVPFDFLDAINGDKNIYSTPRDLLKYDMAMYNDEYISKKIKDEVYKGYSYEKPGIKNYGLGIRLKEWTENQKLFYHNGWWHGNNSCYVSLKKEKVTIIAISNKYTRSVYNSVQISSLFGDYPYEISD